MLVLNTHQSVSDDTKSSTHYGESHIGRATPLPVYQLILMVVEMFSFTDHTVLYRYDIPFYLI